MHRLRHLLLLSGLFSSHGWTEAGLSPSSLGVARLNQLAVVGPRELHRVVHIIVVVLVSRIFEVLALGKELSIDLGHDIFLEIWVNLLVGAGVTFDCSLQIVRVFGSVSELCVSRVV